MRLQGFRRPLSSGQRTGTAPDHGECLAAPKRDGIRRMPGRFRRVAHGRKSACADTHYDSRRCRKPPAAVIAAVFRGDPQRRFFAIEVTVSFATSRLHPLLSPLFAAVCIASGVAASRAAASQAVAAPTVQLAECTLPELSRPARCGSLSVAENPAKPDGRRLSLNIVVVPARNGRALPDPVVFLSGGPGQAATPSAAFLSTALAEVNEERDLLLVDQRGTGASAPLPCALVDASDPAANLREIFPLAAVKRCARALSARADLSQYSLLRFADDLEAVRLALGYSSLNLFGFSYGTRAAQVYLRRYPASSRTAYLGSMIPMDADTLLELPAAAEAVLDHTFAACAADAACRTAFPDLREEFAALLVRLDRGEVIVTVPGARQKVALSRGLVVERVRSLLYTTEGAATVPWLLHEAHAGNWQPLVDQLLDVARAMDAQASLGLFFTITCNEDVAFLREADIRARATTHRFGDLRVRSQQAACRAWPRYRVPNGYRTALRSDVPVLLVSGEFDPATPAALATRAAAGFTQHAQLLLRGQAHSGWSDCVAARYRQFVRRGSTENLDACPETARPAFMIDAEETAVRAATAG